MRKKMDWAITALIVVNIVVIAGLLTVVVADKIGSGSKPGHPDQASRVRVALRERGPHAHGPRPHPDEQRVRPLP